MTETAGHHQHILPLRVYLNIGMTLLALTVVTVWVAQYDLGEINLLVAMAIAVTKGTLVAMYFMHLKYTNKLYATAFVGALLMLAVFITLTMLDTMGRDQIDAFKAKPISDQAIIYRHDTAAAATVIDSTATDSTTTDSSMVDSGH